MIERQELYCHGCDRYIQFNIDIELEGNHVLRCPNCKHEHCRVVKNGIVTDERWGQRNDSMQTFYVSNSFTTSTATSAWTGAYSYNQWMNTCTGTSW